MMKLFKILLFLFFFTQLAYSQNKYELITTNGIIEIPFKFVNNLIILDVQINGQNLNLVFDTGVKQTVLINMHKNDSIDYKNVNKTYFSGIGNEKKQIEGLQSTGNIIQLGDSIVNNNATFYVITGYKFQFSENIGVPINGFIGGELIKDFLVKIDYRKKLMRFYKHNHPPKKIAKYKAYPISIRKDKPYINTHVLFDKSEKKNSVNLLIDTGNSDALWIFTSDNVKLPKKQKYIYDYMGLGFSGKVEGKRVKAYQFAIDNKYKFRNVYAALPDTKYFSEFIRKDINGMMGNEILKRFFVIFDYRNKKLYLKKYRRNYRKDFVFNDSGIYLAYKGKIPIKIKTLKTRYNFDTHNEGTILVSSSSYTYKYQLVDKILIDYIRKDSPADKAGLIKGDVLLKINGENIYRYKLDEIDKKFFFKKSKKLDFVILRNGQELKYHVENIEQF